MVEDQPPAQRILKKFIQDVEVLVLEGVFSDGIKAMDYLKDHEVDLMFLDIHLPKINGIDFLKSLPKAPPVILTTAYSDYALEGYDLNVVDYLLKPFSFQRFLQAVNKLPARNSEGPGVRKIRGAGGEKELYIKSGHEYVRVHLDDIVYISSDTDYTEIHLSNRKVLSGESLKYWMEQFEGPQFLQVHRSYIINCNKVQSLSANQVRMTDDSKIPIGRTYKEEVVRVLLER